MTTLLTDILDPALLGQMLETNMIRKGSHPHLPYAIYNYTEAAQFSRTWNEATLACRGLIVDESTGAVIARPFTKFFNWGEDGAPTSFSDHILVTDKADGSLGITYPTPDGPAISTRGSLASEQAVHATGVLRAKYSAFTPNPAWTYLFEIVYPSYLSGCPTCHCGHDTNRIVVNYGTTDDLILLGAVDIATGKDIPLAQAGTDWPGPVIEQFAYSTIEQVLAAPDRPNREGFVVLDVATGARTKIKQEDYKRLHKMITGVNERTVWEALSCGQTLDEFLVDVPDEFYQFVTTTRDKLLAQYRDAEAGLQARYAAVKAQLPAGYTRKDLALLVMADRSYPLHRLLFTLEDGKDPSEGIWKSLRPAVADTNLDQAA